MSSMFKRINDIVAANINDLIDRVEDPERMVKQIIREMEDNLRRAKEGVIDAVASEKQLAKEVQAQRRQAREWQEKAENAVQQAKEDLARAALARKKEHEQLLARLEPAWQAAANTSDNLKAQLRALEGKLGEAKHKRASLAARQRAAEARQHMQRTATGFTDGLRTEANFHRMEDSVDQIEARTAAIEEVNSEESNLERQFSAMELDAEIDAELAALKEKRREDQE